MNKIEALIDSIGALNGLHNPDSACYQLRNPLMVKSFARPGHHEIDEEGRRRFPSLDSGYRGAYYDIELKLKGSARAKITEESTLTTLLATYGIKELLAIDKVVRFLKRALKDDSLRRDTSLTYFKETK